MAKARQQPLHPLIAQAQNGVLTTSGLGLGLQGPPQALVPALAPAAPFAPAAPPSSMLTMQVGAYREPLSPSPPPPPQAYPRQPRQEEYCVLRHEPQTPLNNEFNPRGNVSAPIFRYAPFLSYVLLVLFVVLAFAHAFAARPWQALSAHGVLLAPRLYVYFFYGALLVVLFYYVGFHDWYPRNVYARSLELPLGVALLAEAIVWPLWAYSEFIAAAVFSFIALVAVLVAAGRIYANVVPGAEGRRPQLSSYLATSLVASTYAGWLFFEFFLLLSAALTKHGAQFFTPRGADSGPRALVITMTVLAFFIALYWIDPHIMAMLAVAFVGVWDARYEDRSDLSRVNGAAFAWIFCSAVLLVPMRYLYLRNRFITPTVCMPRMLS